MRALRTFICAAAFVTASAACADEARTPVPHPPRGQGEHCVADTAFMRRNHMNLMTAHRHEAVHQGVRTPQFSLAGCVACHAVKGEDGKPVSYQNPKHFCRSCHAYAAVQIDCFECHASTPETPAKAASIEGARQAERQDAERLSAYLREVRP